MRDVGFEPGTTASVVWIASNEPASHHISPPHKIDQLVQFQCLTMSQNGGCEGGQDSDSRDGMLDTLLGAPELLKQKRRNEDLESLTRDELVARIVSLEKHVQQLRNVIAKEQSSCLVKQCSGTKIIMRSGAVIICSILYILTVLNSDGRLPV